jgi:hypothetical protein
MGHHSTMTGSDRRPRFPLPVRILLVAAVCTLLGAPVVAAFAASPDPSTPTGPSQANPSGDPDHGPGHGPSWGFGQGFGGQGFGGFGGFGGSKLGDAGGAGRSGVSITAVDGDKISLATDDGWTRTITVTADTTITKAGATIKASDLKVGDEIGFRQKKNDDGTYTITAITVRTPKAGGEVTAVSGSTITVAGRDGTKTVITVTGSTTYLFGKDAGTKADVAVGSRIAAEGTRSGDTFTASRVLIQPSVAGGVVTAKTSSTITVKGRDGKASTIHVDSKTTYHVFGKDAATLADIAVGDVVIASGSQRSDGSLDATQVGGGTFKWGKHDKPNAPGASATP